MLPKGQQNIHFLPSSTIVKFSNILAFLVLHLNQISSFTFDTDFKFYIWNIVPVLHLKQISNFYIWKEVICDATLRVGHTFWP